MLTPTRNPAAPWLQSCSGAASRIAAARATAVTVVGVEHGCGVVRVDLLVLQHHRELVAAEPERQVAAADVRRQHGADPAQHLVARHVPVHVVDLLERVHVDEQQRRRPGMGRAGLGSQSSNGRPSTGR